MRIDCLRMECHASQLHLVGYCVHKAYILNQFCLKPRPEFLALLFVVDESLNNIPADLSRGLF